ncbi:MAG: CHAT domain-containing protein, partial [Nitrospira sp.]
GVPAVVGSLWRVDDRAAAAFFVEFHRRLRDGLSPAEALRQSQLAITSGSNKIPSLWAGFQLIGAGTETFVNARRFRWPV